MVRRTSELVGAAHREVTAVTTEKSVAAFKTSATIPLLCTLLFRYSAVTLPSLYRHSPLVVEGQLEDLLRRLNVRRDLRWGRGRFEYVTQTAITCETTARRFTARYAWICRLHLPILPTLRGRPARSDRTGSQSAPLLCRYSAVTLPLLCRYSAVTQACSI